MGEVMSDKAHENNQKVKGVDSPPKSPSIVNLPELANEDIDSSSDESLEMSEVSDRDTTQVLDTPDFDALTLDEKSPLTPPIGKSMRQGIKEIHALGDLHGWAPALISYLIFHNLAEIKINGKSMGSKGKIESQNMVELFGRSTDLSSKKLPPSGLAGRPFFSDVVNGIGHHRISARWIGKPGQAFVQVGDVFDRADHSELAAEILRQLIIDAPNRVFFLIGNHEQFLIEEERESWVMNEIRNAVTNHRDKPEDWQGKHLRFLSTFELDTDERVSRVFDSYAQSAFLLCFTQAAAQQAALGVDRGLDEEEIRLILSPGWKPYSSIDDIVKKRLIEGEAIPGAIVAFVIGDTLFHHAEPDKGGLATLVDKLIKINHNIYFVDYIYGGGILNKSPHSPLLWARGASSGSSIGKPDAEQQIEEHVKVWPGLFRIVHGHTPTTTIPDFEKAIIDSTTVSYYSQPNSISEEGIASDIRIYNIDEAISPVYFKGKGIEDPTRVPVGLRIVSSKSKRKNNAIIRHKTEDAFLSTNSKREVLKDTRRLWTWQDGESRSNSSTIWKDVSKDRYSTHHEIFGVKWLIETNQTGKALLRRRISGYDIIKNLLFKSLKSVEKLPPSWKIDPDKNALQNLSADGGKSRPFSAFFSEYGERKAAKSFELLALGMKPMSDGSIQLHIINATNNIKDVFAMPIDQDILKFSPKANSISIGRLNSSSKALALSFSKQNHVKEMMDYWLNGNNKPSNEIVDFIGHYSTKRPSIDSSSFILKSWDFILPKQESKRKKKKKKSSQEKDVRMDKQSTEDIDIRANGINKREMPNNEKQDVRKDKQGTEDIDIRANGKNKRDKTQYTDTKQEQKRKKDLSNEPREETIAPKPKEKRIDKTVSDEIDREKKLKNVPIKTYQINSWGDRGKIIKVKRKPISVEFDVTLFPEFIEKMDKTVNKLKKYKLHIIIKHQPKHKMIAFQWITEKKEPVEDIRRFCESGPSVEGLVMEKIKKPTKRWCEEQGINGCENAWKAFIESEELNNLLIELFGFEK
jgi:hypothetical protein